MTLEEAEKILNKCERTELRDHAFGDVEISWRKHGKEIAFGYFSGRTQDVCLVGNPTVTFKGVEAVRLRDCGKEVSVQRNDETGPDEFVLGYTDLSLTTETVRKELGD